MEKHRQSPGRPNSGSQVAFYSRNRSAQFRCGQRGVFCLPARGHQHAIAPLELRCDETPLRTRTSFLTLACKDDGILTCRTHWLSNDPHESCRCGETVELLLVPCVRPPRSGRLRCSGSGTGRGGLRISEEQVQEFLHAREQGEIEPAKPASRLPGKNQGAAPPPPGLRSLLACSRRKPSSLATAL